MVLFSVIGSTLLRGQRFYLPPTFRRYKSLTAAIERGKHGGPDRPFRPRTRTPPGDVEDASPRTRAELRLERFGPSSDRREFTPKPSERSYTSRDEKPRSSRFGRVGSPRSRDDAPSRFREEREERPARNRDEFSQRQEGRFDSPFERPTRSGNRFDEERKPLSDRFERRERLAYRSDDRPSRRDREGYGQRDERPPRREGQFERPDRRPFNRDDKFMGSQHRFSDQSSRGPSREGVSRRGEADRPDRPQRSRQSFTERDEMSPYTRERPEKAQTERYQSREVSQKQSETPTRTTGITEALRSTERGPEVLPYSTAASEFIYGYSSVLAAIKANRRKIYNLYVHSRGASRDGLMTRIRALKLFPVTQEVGDEYLRAMDKASSGRPHNGVVLESSPLPVPPITELKEASRDDESFRVTVDSQSAEDVLVNGKQEIYPYKSAGWRHPLILYVDGVLDEGNLGAIARSAYFLGVDAIITPTRQTAPWSHIALKASAGAAEAIPLFKVGEPTDFLGRSSRAGWRIYASDAIPTPPATSGEKEEPSSNIVYTIARSTKRLPVDYCPVAEHPTILMMGAEGTGLRDSLLNLAHYKVGIKHGREVDEIGVDSLNVSVAASILCYEMLQKPIAKQAPSSEEVLF